MKRSFLKRMLATVSMVSVAVSFTGQRAYAVSEESLSAEDPAIEDTEVSGADDEVTGGNAKKGDDKSTSSEDENTQKNDETASEADSKDIVDNEDTGSADEEHKSDSESDVAAKDREEAENPASDDSEEIKEVSDGNADSSMVNTPDDEKPVSGEFYYETEAEGYHFTFKADENVVPDGTKAVVKLLPENEQTEAKIEEKLGKDIFATKVFDIELFDESGEVIQPKNGDVHISLNLSEEGMLEQDEYEGFTELKIVHLHDEEIADLDTDVQRKDSDIAIPTETDKEVIVSEEDIDPETLQLKEGRIAKKLVLSSPAATEYYQDITLDFDTDSFSEFAIVNLPKYDYPATIDGNVTVYDLSGMKAELDSDFGNVVLGATTKAWEVTKVDKTKYFKVIVPPGTYYKRSTKALRMGNNTTLVLDGVTIINTDDRFIITTQEVKNGEGRFDDYQNIVVSGGVFDAAGINPTHSIIKLAHMTGLTIENATFINSASPHMLEIAACKNVKVKGCTFRDPVHNEGELEAFQIDVQKEGAMHYTMDPVDDDYPCVNVEVSGCTFKNLKRGFGSHGAVTGDFYYKKINVHDCVFDDIQNAAIMCTMWKDSSIKNNTMTNVGRGIDTTTYSWYVSEPTEEDADFKYLSYNANMQISGNQITVGGPDRDSTVRVGMLLSGYYSSSAGDAYPAGVYTVSGFNVSGNTVNGYSNWDNYREDDIHAGIYTIYSAGNNITGNTLKQGRYGILVSGGSEASNIASNGFAGEKDASIAVKNGGIVHDMSGNKLTMDCPFGIFADDTSSCNGSCEVNAYTVGVGEVISTRTNKFSIFTNDLSDKTVGTYKSGKKSVAKTTKAGKVKGVKKGKTQITASWERGNGTVNVIFTANVKKAPKKVKIPKKKNIKKGKTYQLKPKVNKGSHCEKYKYKSDNKKIAKVTSTGLVKARKKGKAVITVTAYNGVKSTMVINVK